ncbi:recombination protein F [Phaeobacter sp. CECT 5382]|uniref:AAA family ATPase n=1 Tax=Phaeobacter sp. CECT 5382 TaxID=1712645 RepID=UPI0006D9D50E|nr:AAA family ATPase [Phaeobacter sp. CECT 5382]CUH89864.1 recombination protein F [Phaeobacter sp. CECT 5382]
MYLKSIRLKNIKCFKDVEIDFDLKGGNNRKWTVLLGENGTGKSTILKSIALLMAGSDALVELVRQPDDLLRKEANKGSIVGTIETKDGKVRELKLDFVRGKGVSRFLSGSQETLQPLNEALEHTNRSYPVFAYGAARRLGSEQSFSSRSPQKHPRARSMSSLFDRNAQLNPLEQWAMDLDYRSGGLQMSIVRKVLSDFLPELTFSEIDKDGRSLLFETDDGLVPLEHLSDGYQNVAAWVGDLLYQITEIFDDYKNPLHARGLLIIDEVDLHLHPKWQRTLLEFLEKQLPNMQLIVTTHSVVTAQQTPENSLFYCIRRDKSRPEIVPFEGDPGKLLLNQLIVTEAFGHISDESVEIESHRARYRKLHKKKKKTKKDLAEMEQLSDVIGAVPEDPSEDIVLSDRQRALMQKIVSRQATKQ